MEYLLDYGASMLEVAGAAAVALLLSRLLSAKLKKYVDLVISLSLLASLLLPLFRGLNSELLTGNATAVYLADVTAESQAGAASVLGEQVRAAERALEEELKKRLQLPEGMLTCSFSLEERAQGYVPVLLTVFWQGEQVPEELTVIGAAISGCPCQVEVVT